MSICLDLGLFLRNSKTKLGLSLTHRGLLFTLAMRIGNNSSTWIKQETLIQEVGIDIKNLQDHLGKIKNTGILIIEKQKSDKRKNQYKFTSLLTNYHQMSEEEKQKVHKKLNDEYCPKKLSTTPSDKGAKSPLKNKNRGRNHPLNRGRNHPLIVSENLMQDVENNNKKEELNSPKETVQNNTYNQTNRAIDILREKREGSVSYYPDEFYPDERRRELLRTHAIRTNNNEYDLLIKFGNVSKKYATKSRNWQEVFARFLEREMPKRTYENLSGKKCRYDNISIY